jgi:hypothetical protein
MRDFLDDKSNIIILICTLLVILNFMERDTSKNTSLILVDNTNKINAKKIIFKKICKGAIESVIDQKASLDFVTPSVVIQLKESNYKLLDLKDHSLLLTKLAGNNTCIHILKNGPKLVGVNSIITEDSDGRLLYRVNTFIKRKVSKEERRRLL